MFRRKKKSPSPKSVPLKTSETGVERYFLKLALMGDGAVGKTNLRRNYLGQGFSRDHLMTIGADFAATEKLLKVGEKDFEITYQIWDLAGQANFNQVREMYYKGCFGALMVFDITRPSSFKNIKNWLGELEKHSGRGPVPFVVLGNKFDLVDSSENVVSEEQITKLMEELNEEQEKRGFKVLYMNTSALTGLNVEEAFDTLGETIISWLGVAKSD